MYLKELSLVNFKNYREAKLAMNPRINCFVGENGCGKTNLLDSMHYLALCKSYFNPVDSQNILHECEFGIIQGEFQDNGKPEHIYCGIQRSKRKKFQRNKKDYGKLSEHIGLIPLVMISPSDFNLIQSGGEERRRFINGVISQFDRDYLESLLLYNRILNQRNKYLKTLASSRSSDLSMLDVYDEQLSNAGQEIYAKRKAFVSELIPVFSKYYRYISGEREEVSLSFQSQLDKGEMLGLLKACREKDRILQYSSLGIHRDDLEMLISGYSLKKSGSQGQQKTFQVALKLAKFEFIQNVSGISPILLLDDIFDKFDHQRVEQIIRLVFEENFGQIFITDTDENRMKSILQRVNGSYKLFGIMENQEIKILHEKE